MTLNPFEPQTFAPQIRLPALQGDDDGQMVEGGVGGAAAGEPPAQQVTREEASLGRMGRGNGNYYSSLGLCIGIMEKKMETTIVDWGSFYIDSMLRLHLSC